VVKLFRKAGEKHGSVKNTAYENKGKRRSSYERDTLVMVKILRNLKKREEKIGRSR
jgi:soluble P-type ATPase